MPSIEVGISYVVVILFIELYKLAPVRTQSFIPFVLHTLYHQYNRLNLLFYIRCVVNTAVYSFCFTYVVPSTKSFIPFV
jgi:hypothetical protein